MHARAPSESRVANAATPCNNFLTLKASLQSELRGQVRAQLLELISEHADSLTPSERQIADRLLSEPVTSGFASASELARDLKISPSTVVRFAQSLGFSGWLELQGALKHESSERQRLIEMAPSEERFLSAFVNVEADNLRYLLGQDEALEASAQLLADAEQVWLVGDRASRFVAGVAHHFLNMARPGVWLLEAGATNTADALLDVAPGQAALVVSIARYSRATYELAKHLAESMPTVLLTDEFTSPFLSLATTRLRVGTAGISSWKSTTAAFSLTQALVMEIARRSPTARDRLSRAEQIWSDLGIYLEQKG